VAVAEIKQAKPRTARQLAAALGPELALLTVVTLWASTFIVTKDAFDEMTPLAFIFVRFLLMTTLAFGVLVVGARGDHSQLKIQRSDLPQFVLVGITGYTFYQLGFVFGVEKTSAFSSALLISMQPLFTMLILAKRGEPTPQYGWIGLGIAVTGVAIFMLDKRGGENSTLGNLLSLGAGLSFATYGILNRPLVKRYQPATYSAYSVLIGSIPLLLISIPDAVKQDWVDLPAKSWLAIVYMVIFPVYVAYQFWNWGIAKRGAAEASSFALLVPIIAGVLSAIVFSESFGWAKLVGGALAMAGLVAIRIDRKPKSGESR
jgi:drug/metabolite transporter (DMT)-like permease